MARSDEHLIPVILSAVRTPIGRFLGMIDAAIDKYLVDGLVNAVANVTIGAGKSLRTVQTGRIQTYLYGALGGALVVVLLNFLIS